MSMPGGPKHPPCQTFGKFTFKKKTEQGGGTGYLSQELASSPIQVICDVIAGAWGKKF